MFLPKLLPGKWLNANGAQRRNPHDVAHDKRQMRGDVCLGLLADLGVQARLTPFKRVHLLTELRWHRRIRSRKVYLPEDPSNAAYALKAAIDGIVDAGLLPDDSYRFISVLSTAVRVVGSFEEEGLLIVITELEDD